MSIKEWEPDVVYEIDDVVVVYDLLYKCIKNHTSTIFANQFFDNNKVWAEIKLDK